MKFLALVFFILLSFFANSQISNPSFEHWNFNQGAEIPADWNLSQDSSVLRFEKSLDAVDGLYSLKIYPGEPDPFYFCHNSMFQYSNINVDITDSTYISCFLKTQSVDNSDSIYLVIYTYFYSADSLLISYQENEFFNVFNKFRKFNLGFVPQSTDFIDIFVRSGGVLNQNHDCSLKTISWLDNFEISNSATTVNNLFESSKNVIIHPNPFSFNTVISGIESNEFKIQIFDLNGIEKFNFQLDGTKLFFSDSGVYILKIIENNRAPIYIKFISI